ncbi:hypothetical protein FKW15_12565 [Acetobacter sp. DmW_125133]|uniref:Uncharacterized protein n=2 Tax=Acetobacter TaxID=434 RepID=A0AAN1U9I0_9PROT|nr:hypothetical protein CBI36_03770 [Acetobacter oryzifermentans]ATI11714.1 hypothetical protein CPF11_04080 [Acetobacter pomorum]AXC27670.1 hypothetical protein DS739_03590 [Acetobacter sp. JWB]KAA8385280.1 hypothetical protein FKW31_08900 [Acetobacter sp. DmW_136]KAA8395869.1 hypothetical protein FKW22_07310 [Acetobacter sp. DmW_125124]KAA8398546.1 hypothetical protein FKW20_06185 [Acetobacter sp. DmW_125127]KAA8399080.1 hypothetical protein FKW19_03075 [Acetobacter sp. DmW_125128]KAA84028
MSQTVFQTSKPPPSLSETEKSDPLQHLILSRYGIGPLTRNPAPMPVSGQMGVLDNTLWRWCNRF